jgi:hypothetical protein
MNPGSLDAMHTGHIDDDDDTKVFLSCVCAPLIFCFFSFYQRLKGNVKLTR